MRILLFTENTHVGGLDTFLAALANHWPYPEDELTIVCNRWHPGLSLLAQRLSGRHRVIGHEIVLYADLVRRTADARLGRLARRSIGPLIRYALLAYEILALRRVLGQARADRLMVVNGGHPGGDSCRAAVITWGLFFRDRPRAVYNVHNVAAAPRWFERAVEYVLDRLVRRYAKAVVTVSRACADSLAGRPGLARGAGVSFIYNGIAPPAPAPGDGVPDVRLELRIPAGSRLCLMLATYEPRKGHGFLLQAFRAVAARLPDAHLLICGDGRQAEIDEVRRKVEELGLRRCVHLQGYRTDVPSLLRQADVLVVPSQEDESFGLTGVEAMAHRVPVVATRVGGIPEVVADGEGGYCVARDDVTGFADRITRFLMDPEFRTEQGERGFRRYERRFRAERMAAEYAAVIRDRP